ncbi:hypothetical protein ABFP60_14855 [Clostridioides difficile]
MGVWGLDIYDDDLAVDIRDEFQGYLDEGMDENEAMDELLLNNDNLLEDEEESGTFILTIGLLAKENEIHNNKIKKLLRELKNNKNYWIYLQEDSMELYEARIDLFRELT